MLVCVYVLCQQVVLGGGQEAREVTTTTTKAGKFDTRFYHLVFEEEIGRVKSHFWAHKFTRIHPNGKRWALIRVELNSGEISFQFQLQQWRGGWLCESAHL